MARRTTWSIMKIDGEFAVLRGGRPIGFRPGSQKDAEKYIRAHMAAGDKTQFVEKDGYAVPLPLRPL